MTRLLKLAVSLFVYALSYCRDRIRRALGKHCESYCVVLYYHIVGSESRKRFASQLDMLLRWSQPIAAHDTPCLEDGVRYAAVTFDDAFESILQNALPELEKRGIPSTIFAISDFLGKEVDWEGYPDRIMSAEQLKSLPADRVKIGSHTLSHPMLPALSEEEAKRELQQSRLSLQHLLSYPITTFSFPYGAFNEQLVEWCRDAGYERIFTTLPQLAWFNKNDFVLGRVSVEPTDWPIEFYLKLTGSYRWLPLAFMAKRKMLAYFRTASKARELAPPSPIPAVHSKVH